ncbi:MAG: S8 family peptidase [Bacteroidetes bacterium]|nr:S8 family peptidase [Bacteroidota bacterium]
MQKHKWLLGLIIALPLKFYAQELSKANFSLVKKIYSDNSPSKRIAIFAQGDNDAIRAYTIEHGGVVKFVAGDISSLVLPLSAVNGLAALKEVSALEDNSMKLIPMDDSMRVRNNINPVQNGAAPLPQGYDGTGVVMGMIDSGIDFTHPDFKNPNGTTRVLYIWDQNISAGTAPMPYNYGTEFNSADINAGNASAHVDNSNGHGTHVTGMAAGNGSAVNAHKGVAPKADIISVCLNWNLSDNDWLTTVADAVNYIYNKALALNKPCVINISAGSYYGSHDGKDLQAQAISNLIAQHNGRSLVCAAGNAGQIPFHLKHNHTFSGDTTFTWFNYNSFYGNAIYVEMWSDVSNFSQMKFAIGADKVSPIYELQTMGNYYNVSQNLGTLKTDTLYGISGNRIALVQRFASLANGRYSMIFNIIPDSTQYRFRLSTTNPGSFNLWSFQMTPSSGLPTPLQFPDIVNYIAPDLNQTIVSSFSCSDKVITVGEHKNRMTYIDCSNNLFVSTTNYTPCTLAPQSSHGPTRDGRLKPEICASGGMSIAAGAYNVLPNLPNTNKALGCMHIRDGGTSTASPVVAGIAALILQRFPNATWQQIKDCITQNAIVDSLVSGTIPNNAWGYGRADGFAAMLGCSYLSTFESNEMHTLNISPNPFSNEIKITSDLTINRVTLLDATGRVITDRHISAVKSNAPQTFSLSLPDIAPGFYLVKVYSGAQSSVARLVKN